jgi:hypothetical protein
LTQHVLLRLAHRLMRLMLSVRSAQPTQQCDKYFHFINKDLEKKYKPSRVSTQPEFTTADRNINDNTPILVP